jgi:hypothetical protein
MLAEAPSVRLATALLEAIAQNEAAGRRGARLTEPSKAPWQRFRGPLGNADFLRRLVEDGLRGFRNDQQVRRAIPHAGAAA